MTYHHEIQDAESNVEQLKRAYLKRFGWSETCSTPGSYWLWRRDFANIDAKRKMWDDEHEAGQPGKPSRSQPYGVVTASLDLAIAMTLRCLDEQSEIDADAA